MNSQIFMRAAKFISLIGLYFTPFLGGADWSVDFSKRQGQMGGSSAMPTMFAEPAAEERNLFDRVFESSLPVQDIVIINTANGFVPSTVQIREGAQYRFVVVNVNENKKNVSFVLDSFSEHHATFYGKIKTFMISPKKEGVYTFLSPETSAQGRLVVHSANKGTKTVDVRAPASE